ncbi:TetR/AcrR family transcriptional regulator [Glycocaulis profundi]|nr:TetR/AcrR family transcriptional regulator [Glycocaulis profundi]
MPPVSPATRVRNAAATRSAILQAARERFARDSYENVGVRDIASGAGVDAALVSRYFGSKEELFAEVLKSGKRGLDVIGEDMDGLPERVADLLLDQPAEDKPLDDLLVALHSAGSPQAGHMIRASISERFHVPLAQLLGGENAELRARVFGAVLMGMAISQKVAGEFEIAPEVREPLRARIADLVRLALSPL